MKIKTTKQMDILELAQAVRDREALPGSYTNSEGETFHFGNMGVNFGDVDSDAFVYSDTFEIDVLEELTEETPIPCRVFRTYANKCLAHNTNGSSYPAFQTIKGLKNKSYGILSQVFAINDDTLGQLIWDKENGFADGILEVEE